MPVISKEPGSMHVQTPRCFIPRYKDSQIRIFLSSVGPVKVPHQHIENTFWGERFIWSKKRMIMRGYIERKSCKCTWCKHPTYCRHSHSLPHIQPSIHLQDPASVVPKYQAKSKLDRVQWDSPALICNPMCRDRDHTQHQCNQTFLLAECNHTRNYCHGAF